VAFEFKACSVDSCNGNAHGSVKGRRGYCTTHYKHWLRHGNPLGSSTRTHFPGKVQKFIREIALTHKGDCCLIWPFHRNDRGYGTLSVGDKIYKANRYICMLVHGEPPTPKHQAAHNCGKGHEGCVNPSHLRWATPKENAADKIVHDTYKASCGSNNGRSKLTEPEARTILRLKGIKSQSKLAAEFGVTIAAIANIHSRRNWSWL
jgi:hypothetical protein